MNQTFNKLLGLSALIVLIDQIIKILIKMTLFEGEEVVILGDFFKLTFTENPGAAFGLTFVHLFEPIFGGLTDNFAKYILTIFSIVLVGFLVWYLKKIENHPKGLQWVLAIILGGAIGNVIDRTFYGAIFTNEYEGGFLLGRVVDMFYFDVWRGTLPSWIPFFGGEYYSLWPVFNIADIAISVGIILIFANHKKYFEIEVVNEINSNIVEENNDKNLNIIKS